MKQVKDSLRLVMEDSTYRPQYDDYLVRAEALKDDLPLPYYLGLRSMFGAFIEVGKSQEAIDTYLATIEDFQQEYPNYKEQESIQDAYESVKYSLVNKQAPVMQLADTSGKLHTFPDPNGKYILLDVWGSWCYPCRFYNEKLVKLNEELKKDGRVKLVSVAFEYDHNQKPWKQAIVEDSLTWQQLFYTDEFLEQYRVEVYPTVYLIAPDGTVLTKQFNIQEIDQYIKKE